MLSYGFGGQGLFTADITDFPQWQMNFLKFALNLRYL